MKKRTTGIFLIMFFVISNLFAANSLKFSERVKNLGTIEQFKKFKWVVKVKNISDKPVSFTNIKTTCGCTVARPEKNTLQPGDEINFIVHFNSEYFQGHVEKLVFIDTSTGERYTLRVLANVHKSVYLEPKRINITPEDDYIEQLIEVKGFKNLDKIKIKKVILPKIKGITYEITGNRSFVLKANPAKIDISGLKIAKIILNGDYQPLLLYINIKKIKNYTVSPSDNLLFLNIKKGRNYGRTVYIKSNYKFNILTKKSNVSFIKIKELKKLSDKKWKVSVTLSPDKIEKASSGKTFLILETDNSKFKTIKLGIVFHIIK